MLNMSHRVGNYHKTPLRVSSMKSIVGTAPAKFPTRVERETIHSGHFMVSTFEAEEALDDLDDSEIKMLDPEDPSLVKPGEANNCMEVQLYVPRKVIQEHDRGCGDTVEIITSHLEIETSLTKLFKCMNLAYSQKLTSPKWNHFKGVRLRWKDKIRLNNVIWRCWHMQFILKRKTLVCQFASPLDVDIHSNPQSVVLEGKYWKRQLAVIKAEYRKWRRNYKSTKMGCLTYDTKSEFDFLEWSPINDRHLMTNEDWTTDTLFSAINVPFPFPDSREIARGAGIADFIQPSLGPLQPNLDDIDLTFVELLQNTRLPSVPEEGSEEMLKNVDYGFSEIMGTEQLSTNSTINVTGSSAVETSLSTASEDANMIELDTPLSALEFVQMEEEMSPSMCSSNNAQIIKGTNQTEKRFNVNGGDTIMGELSPNISLRTEILQHTNRSSKTLYASPVESNNIPIAGNVEVPIGTGRQCSNDFPVKKGRISKNSQRPFRREPHNYDKAQPTLHQTNIYQQILAEQHKIQQFPKQDKASVTIPPTQQQNSQNLNSQLEYQSNTSVYNLSSPNNQFEGNNCEGVVRIVNDSNMTLMDLISNNATLNLSTQCQQGNTASVTNARVETPSSEVLSMFNLTTPSDVYTPANSIINTYKPHPHLASFKKSASTGNYFNLRMACHPSMYMPSDLNTQGQSSVIAGNQTTFISPSPVGNQLKVLANGTSASSSNVSTSPGSLSSAQLNTAAQLVPSIVSPQNQINLSVTAQPINADAKEIYRSNSLPLNVILPKMESHITQSDYFAMPKYHPVKNGKNRSRSNSINHSPINAKPIKSVGNHFIITPNVTTQLQTATSEPMLNSAIGHLLSKSHMTSAAKQQSASTSGISTTNLSNAQNKLTMRDSAGSLYISPSAPTDIISSSSHLLMNPMSLTTDDSVSRHGLKHSGEIQDQQQPPHKSPKKSDSLPKLEQPIKAINSLSTATNTSLINYPLSLSNVTQATSSFQNQTLSQTDVYASLSPTQTLKNPRDSQRRVGHIHAEQKRRYNIKNGFDQLHDLIPQLQQSNAKLSKAAMLQKGVEHIKHLRNERNVLKQQMDALRLERDALNNSLSHLHSILPANGAPVTRQGTEHVKKLYEEYVHYRTMENWKFWILGLILEPLLTSYTTTVSSASMDELRRTAFLWVDQHCSLIDLRPAVSNKLKYLSMNTDILSDPPSTLQEEVIKAMNSNSCQHPNLHGT